MAFVLVVMASLMLMIERKFDGSIFELWILFFNNAFNKRKFIFIKRPEQNYGKVFLTVQCTLKMQIIVHL